MFNKAKLMVRLNKAFLEYTLKFKPPLSFYEKYLLRFSLQCKICKLVNNVSVLEIFWLVRECVKDL